MFDAGRDRGRGVSGGVLAAERDELVLRIGPGDRRHVGLLGRPQLEMIGAPIGVDDEVGDQVRPRRLDQDVDALGRPGPALGIADDPAHGVAGGDRTGADELLAGFERDVGHFAGCSVDLIERAVGEGIDLDGVDVAGARRLHARGAIRLLDARARIGGLPAVRFRAPGSASAAPAAAEAAAAPRSARVSADRAAAWPAAGCRRS